MRILPTLNLSLAVILNSIELSLQFDCLPNGAPIPGVPRCESLPDRPISPGISRSKTSSATHSSARHSSVRQSLARHSPVRHAPASHSAARHSIDVIPHGRYESSDSSAARFSLSKRSAADLLPVRFPDNSSHHVRFSHPSLPTAEINSGGFHFPRYPHRKSHSNAKTTGELPAAESSRTKPTYPESPLYLKPSAPSRIIALPNRLPSPDGHGCGLENLRFIRLTSKLNPRRTFELRRYTFLAGTRIKLRRKEGTYEPVPATEQIVMTTFNGDTFAILESVNVLAGMYIHNKYQRRRVKINTFSGNITVLTSEEIDETPVGGTRPIRTFFHIEQLNRM